MIKYIGNDEPISITGLTDALSGDFINDAIITAVLKHRNGTNVSGQSWPLTLDYVADSDGDYRGILGDALALTDGRLYNLEITVELDGSPPAQVAFYRIPTMAKYRTE